MNRLEVLIYKVQPYGENGRLLQAYSKKGKVSLIASGSQKLNSDLRILSQYLTVINFEYKTFNSILPLRNAKLINDYSLIKSKYILTKQASVLLEVISKIYLDDEYHEKIYTLLIDSLNHNDIELSSISFLLKLTYYLGYGLDLKGNGNMIKGFSILKGGVVYKEEDYLLDLNYEDTFKLLKITYSKINVLESIDEIDKKKFINLIYNYYLSKIDLKLESFK